MVLRQQAQTPQPTSLQPGQRAPNFALPNVDGRSEQFYDRFLGNSMVLTFVARADSPAAAALLAELEKQRAALKDAGAAVVAVAVDSRERTAATRARQGLGFPLYADPDGAASSRYTAPPAATGREGTSFVLDRNQRVLAVLTTTDCHAQAALEVLRAQPSATEDSRRITGQAPVLLVPNVLDAALCAEAIAAWGADNEEGLVNLPQRAYAEDEVAKPVHNVYLDLKKRRDHITSDALNARIMGVLSRHLFPELLKSFRFRVGTMERICIGAYEAGRGDFFRPHRDNMTETTRNRAFAVTLSLNDDYQGGGVRFAEFSDDVYAPPAGGALVFSCSLLHEALPVTEGRRMAAFTFLTAQGTKADNPFPGAA